MADSNLGSLRDRLRRSLEKEVTPLTQVESPAAADFVRLIGSVNALERLASDVLAIDRMQAQLAGAPSDASAQIAALSERREALVASIETLVSEMEA